MIPCSLPDRVVKRLHRIKWWVWTYISEHPFICYIFYTVRPLHRTYLVDRDTELVIEGFPRSANTFAVWAFKQAQERDVVIAHHLHASAQIITATHKGIPILVLIREPREAILSLMIREPTIPADCALHHYLSFYRVVAHYRDFCVLGTFGEVVDDYGLVIDRVNAKFCKQFTSFVHTEENVKSVFDHIGKLNKRQHGGNVEETSIARPSDNRGKLKSELDKQLTLSKNEQELLVQANFLYHELTKN